MEADAAALAGGLPEAQPPGSSMLPEGEVEAMAMGRRRDRGSTGGACPLPSWGCSWAPLEEGKRLRGMAGVGQGISLATWGGSGVTMRLVGPPAGVMPVSDTRRDMVVEVRSGPPAAPLSVA
jgi:hypothetical protein